ncbi:MAG: ABC transporter-like protein [Rhodocyclaceae bacterium]|nr:MAG: ABC transporter-like protein [Rhodocyclaceae bacterium]TND04739.1 MAG: ABC transporter-like protein [Rhodocyclaceae bacterium]
MNPESCTLRLAGLRKSYRVGEASVEALKGVSLDVFSGEMVALTGPSGSGKSTLLNLCGLIDKPDAGSRELCGTAINGLDEIGLTGLRREKVGFIFQGFNLVPVMTVFDNVEYPLLLLGVPAPARRELVMTALQRVGLEAFARRLPDALSGGQRQRVAIARALVKSPALVIADEPTANLDSTTARQIVDLLHELAHERNASVVVATHDERMSSHCDRVLHLIDGELQ